jgi:BirA family biotin operon repressor/biotin-[acetyl-CoA-carboxylase] ligase
MSLVLKPSLRANEAVKLVFVASLATAEILKDLYGLRVETKWPNDVLVKGKKICGILCEMNATGEKVNFAVVGIGVNVNLNVKRALPRELAETATSLQDELGRQIGVEDLFRTLVEKLEKVYLSFLKEGFAIVLDGWKKHAKFLGKSIEVTSGADRFSGIAVDVDSDGSLILRQGDNLVRIVSGDLSFR